MKLTKENNNWILRGETKEYTYECNISQLNPGHKFPGLDVDHVVEMIQQNITDDKEYCYGGVYDIDYNDWKISLPVQITPSTQTLETLCDMIRVSNNYGLCFEDLCDRFKSDFTDNRIRDLEKDVWELKKEKRYRLCHIEIPYPLLEAYIQSCEVYGPVFNEFSKGYHNCTKEFLIDEFCKRHGTTYLYTSLLEIYAKEYGLRLVNGDTYTSFKDVIRWEIGEKTKRGYRTIECKDASKSNYGYEGIVRFGDTHIGWF